MRFAWVLVACGCDAVFGLRTTELPVPQIDAIATACPPIGTAPVFSPYFYQVTAQNCTDYSPSTDANLAIASCEDNGTPVIEAGPLDQPLAELALAPVSACALLEHARLVPEGDHAFVVQAQYDCEGNNEIGDYALAAGTWTYAGALAIPHGTNYFIGDVTHAPNRHAMLTTSDGTLHELVQQDDTSWQDVGSYIASDLGLSNELYTPPNLTPDGLRAIVYGSSPPAVYYIDRPDLASRFAAAQPLLGVPVVPDAHLTEDCTHVYFSGVEHVLYVRQQ